MRFGTADVIGEGECLFGYRYGKIITKTYLDSGNTRLFTDYLTKRELKQLAKKLEELGKIKLC